MYSYASTGQNFVLFSYWINFESFHILWNKFLEKSDFNILRYNYDYTDMSRVICK